jgi:hypothetical protein
MPARGPCLIRVDRARDPAAVRYTHRWRLPFW